MGEAVADGDPEDGVGDIEAAGGGVHEFGHGSFLSRSCYIVFIPTVIQKSATGGSTLPCGEDP
ncbi:hypothetical protein GCM10010441_36510 [Kitasatospora paracochleata]